VFIKTGVLFLLALSVTLQFAKASSLPDCSADKLSMNGQYEDECISTCTAIANVPAAQLAIGSDGFCVGDASESVFTLYEVKLGQSAQENATCNLWTGSFIVDKARYSAGQVVQPGGVFSYCAPGLYDVVFVTVSRVEAFAGSATFPDGSGRVARTTARFSGDAGTYTDLSTWLETSSNHSDNSLPYVRPAAGWNNVFKKLAESPSDQDLSGTSPVTMYFDWAKNLVLDPVSTLLPGWYCENNAMEFCERILDDGRIEMRATMNNDGVFFPAGGLRVTDRLQPNWNISYFGLNSAAERGLRFIWRNDGGTLKYLGANPGESGIEVTISTVDVLGSP
jgi:hypothetical protein